MSSLFQFWTSYLAALQSSPAAFWANIINPLLIALLLIAPVLRRRSRAAPGFWLAGAAGILAATFLAERAKAHQVWPGHPGFPSGHETFAVAAGTALLGWDRRWAILVLPLLALLGGALVAAKYHDLPDILGAVPTGALPALLCQGLWQAAQRHSAKNFGERRGF